MDEAFFTVGGGAFLAAAPLEGGLRDFVGAGMGGSFSGFWAAVRVRFAVGEGGRSGEAARFFVGWLLGRAGSFSSTFGAGCASGFSEAARVERRGGIES